MIEIICKKSGLKFEAADRRTQIHPKILGYIKHENHDIRYQAISLIERGKAEGWHTIEKFEAEIQLALTNPTKQKRPTFNFEGAWVAKITGSSEQYRFTREFLVEVDTEGNNKRFVFEGDGVYECCYACANGDRNRYYYNYSNGISTELTLTQVDELFPALEPDKPVSVEGCIKVEKYLGAFGSKVEHDGSVFVVVRIDSIYYWEDDEGLSGSGDYYGDSCLVYDETKSTSFLRPATEEETKEFKQLRQLQEVTKAHIKTV